MHSMTQSKYYNDRSSNKLSQVTVKTDINKIQCCFMVESTIVSVALGNATEKTFQMHHKSK